MCILSLEFHKTLELLPEKDQRVIMRLNETFATGWFHGKVFETDSEYLYEIDEVDSWAYLPKGFESEVSE